MKLKVTLRYLKFILLSLSITVLLSERLGAAPPKIFIEYMQYVDKLLENHQGQQDVERIKEIRAATHDLSLNTEMTLLERIESLFIIYPEYAHKVLTDDDYPKEALIHQETFLETIKKFKMTMERLIVQQGIPLAPLRDQIEQSNFYIQKLHVNEGDNITFIGDMHSSAHSLGRNLYRLIGEKIITNEGKILNQDGHKNYIIFTGDVADRGRMGVETWYLIMTLKILNPHNVFIVRGNHENIDTAKKHGFFQEMQLKFKNNQEIAANMIENFSLLPSAILISGGTNQEHAVVVSHGGVPLHHDNEPPRHLDEINLFYSFVNQLLQTKGPCAHHFSEIEYPKCFNYLTWNDFDLEGICEFQGVYHGFRKANELFASINKVNEQLRCSLKLQHVALIRGHQHSNPTTGITKILPISNRFIQLPSDTPVFNHTLYTLTSCPEGTGGRYKPNKDSEGFSMLSIGGSDPKTWIMTPYHFLLPNERHNKNMFITRLNEYVWIPF